MHRICKDGVFIMAVVSKITGVEQVLANIKRVEIAAGRGVEKGLKLGGLLIQADSQKEVPVDQGVLKNSSFTRKLSGMGHTANIGVGYTAAYAAYVHENLDAAHGDEYNEKYATEIAGDLERRRDAKGRFLKNKKKWHNRGSGQKAKFLEDPARRDAPLVQVLITKSIKLELAKVL